MRKLLLIAIVLTTAAFVSTPWRGSAQTTRGGSKSPPIVSRAGAPAGTEKLAVQWLRISVPDLGAILAAVARPPGPVPFRRCSSPRYPWIRARVRPVGPGSGARWLPRRRAVLVFGRGGSGSHAVTPPIPCPEIPALKRDAYPEVVQDIDAVVKAARALPGARADRLGIVGHSRGGGETLQYLLAIGNVQAAVLHSAGHGYRPVTRVAEFNVPMLILHGTADGPADGGGVNTQVALVRFEAALRQNRKPVEAHYYEGGGHNTFFTNSTQHDDELKTMITFLRRHLGV